MGQSWSGASGANISRVASEMKINFFIIFSCSYLILLSLSTPIVRQRGTQSSKLSTWKRNSDRRSADNGGFSNGFGSSGGLPGYNSGVSLPNFSGSGGTFQGGNQGFNGGGFAFGNTGGGFSGNGGFGGSGSGGGCRTVFEQECSSVNEQVCSTVPEQQCSTVNRQQCSTEFDQQCSTVNEQQCSTVNEQQCNTVIDT